MVLYILADLISFLEIQRLQPAGSSSTVFAANLICNKQRFAYVANECSLQWFISICLINSIWLLSISFFLLAIFSDKATASGCIQLFLDRLSEKCARDNPKGNMGYDQYIVPDDRSCRTYFCSFPPALEKTFPWPFVPILSNFFEEQGTQN